ncbi:MAG: hypothetical protein ACXVH3_26790 [Solirubrobacteraceae bacterium]
MLPAEPDQTISSRAGRAWRDEDVRDYGSIGLGWLMFVLVTLRDRKIRQRLADVEIPNGTLFVVMAAALVRQRRTERALAEFAERSGELGTLLGTRMRESDERAVELLSLQASVEQLTRWLVVLTVVLGAIGVGGIAATLWAALK